MVDERARAAQARRVARAGASRHGGLASGYNREKYQAPGVTAVVTPLAEAVLGPTRATLLALLGGVGLVLLVACANVAALQAVQVDERAAEIALRLALGASAARVGRGLLAESLVLGLLGGGLGVLGAFARRPALVALSPREVPRLAEATLDATTLAVALGADARRRGRDRARARSWPDATARCARHSQGGARSLASGGSRLRAALVDGRGRARARAARRRRPAAAQLRGPARRAARLRRRARPRRRGRARRRSATPTSRSSAATSRSSSRACGRCPASSRSRP